MNMGQKLKFLLAFAWQDLFERNARRITWVILFTIGLLTFLTLVGFGLALGSKQVQLAQLKQDPLALCLWATDMPLGKKITPKMLKTLRTGIPSHLNDSQGFLGCYPFYEAEYVFYMDLSGGRVGANEVLGRTLAPGDPLFASLELQSGTSPGRDDAEGIWVTAELLRVLGEPTQPPPETLKVRVSGMEQEVPIRGVFRGRLPLGHQFVVTEAYHDRLLTEDPDVRTANIRTGLVPAGWPRPGDTPIEWSAELAVGVLGTACIPTVQPWGPCAFLLAPTTVHPLPRLVKRALALSEVVILGEEARVDGGKVWVLSSDEDPPPRVRKWRASLQKFHELIVKADRVRHQPSKAFMRVNAPSTHRKLPQREGHDLAGVYVRDLADLQPAADVIRSQGMRVNEDVIQQIEGIGRSTQKVIWVLISVVGSLILMAWCNVTAIQYLRAAQKVREIGMLKALGMNDGLLRQVYLTEALLLALLALVFGSVLGLLAGYGIAWALSHGPEDRFTAFWCPWYLLGSVFGGGLLVCVVSTLWGTYRARRKSPIEMLSAP